MHVQCCRSFCARARTKRRPWPKILETQQPLRLPPTLDLHELPPEFEDVLEVQVLGYRERLTLLDGRRLRVLDPVWTLVPKDR